MFVSLGMCRPKSPNIYKNSLELASSIEELNEPIPELFSALTEEEDPEQRWTIYTYPAHLDLLYFKPGGIDAELNLATNLGTFFYQIVREMLIFFQCCNIRVIVIDIHLLFSLGYTPLYLCSAK